MRMSSQTYVYEAPKKHEYEAKTTTYILLGIFFTSALNLNMHEKKYGLQDVRDVHCSALAHAKLLIHGVHPQ